MAALTLAERARGRDNNFHLVRMLAALLVLVSHSWPLTGTPSDPFERVVGEERVEDDPVHDASAQFHRPRAERGEQRQQDQGRGEERGQGAARGPDPLHEGARVVGHDLGLHRGHDVRTAEVDLHRGGRSGRGYRHMQGEFSRRPAGVEA